MEAKGHESERVKHHRIFHVTLLNPPIAVCVTNSCVLPRCQSPSQAETDAKTIEAAKGSLQTFAPTRPSHGCVQCSATRVNLTGTSGKTGPSAAHHVAELEHRAELVTASKFEVNWKSVVDPHKNSANVKTSTYATTTGPAGPNVPLHAAMAPLHVNASAASQKTANGPRQRLITAPVRVSANLRSGRNGANVPLHAAQGPYPEHALAQTVSLVTETIRKVKTAHWRTV